MNAAAAPALVSDLGLWLYVRGADRLLAIDAGGIERALLLDEAPAVESPALLGMADAPASCLGVLLVRGCAHPAWDLGVMLGGAPSRRAWILFEAGLAHETLPVALRTDECLHVGRPPAGRRLALPAGVLGRRRACRSAFVATRVAGLHAEAGAVGYDLDVRGLLDRSERERSLELVRHFETRGVADGSDDHV
jgi:hypothetical protein